MKPKPSAAEDPSHDDLIKKLLLQPKLLVDFFRAFLPEVLKFADLSQLEYLDKEHPRTKRRPRRSGDLLVKIQWKDKPVAFLIHFESQSTPQEKLIERATEYAMRDSIRYGLPVMPVILLTYSKPEKVTSTSLMWDFGKLASIHVHCPVLHFRRMDPRPHLKSHNVTALALSSLMKLSADQEVDVMVETLAECLRQKLSVEDRESALEFIRAYIQLQEEQLLQIEQKVHKLASKDKHLVTMPKIINPFIELGKLKGRQEGEVAFVRRLVEKKFPGIAKRSAALAAKLDEEDRFCFGEALLFMESPAQCIAWLKERV
jgi:Putative transposase, YhgA-like